MTSLRLFHYTMASRLEQILETRQILPATCYVPVHERPTVWLSLHPRWEPTATKGILDANGTRRTATFAEMIALDRPCRIEVGWREWSVRSGVKKKVAKGLRRTAERQGVDVNHWRMSFEPVAECQWITVEIFADTRWISLDDPLEDRQEPPATP